VTDTETLHQKLVL